MFSSTGFAARISGNVFQVPLPTSPCEGEGNLAVGDPLELRGDLLGCLLERPGNESGAGNGTAVRCGT